jgi:hypothetical protein
VTSLNAAMASSIFFCGRLGPESPRRADCQELAINALIFQACLRLVQMTTPGQRNINWAPVAARSCCSRLRSRFCLSGIRQSRDDISVRRSC